MSRGRKYVSDGTKLLSTCEEMVMAIVWDSDPAPNLAETVSRVNAKFDKAWKPQTVSTFLARLVKKGFLTPCRKGRSVYYEPVGNKEEYCAAEVIRIVELYYKGDTDKLAQLVRSVEKQE